MRLIGFRGLGLGILLYALAKKSVEDCLTSENAGVKLFERKP